MNAHELKEIEDVCDMLHDLPSGIDMDADPNNTSPEDMTAHIGGLCWQRLMRIVGTYHTFSPFVKKHPLRAYKK